MKKRVTIVLDDDLDKRIRIIQAKIIRKEKKSVSFSKVLNNMLSKAIKK
ncbi:MAG: hypothetical protein K5793_08760 [Nitrosarchaeum sp.]|nr:hypothetical protein [Nitrosarchaeum sp.]